MKTLVKEFGGVGVAVDMTQPSGSQVTIASQTQEYEQVPDGLGFTFVASTYFDLAGLAQDYKTLFFDGAAMQEVLNPFYQAGTPPGTSMAVVDLMTTKPLTLQQAQAYSAFANFPGSPTGLSYMETIFGRVRIFTSNIDTLDANYFAVFSDEQSGSLSATATDRIYCYRVVVFPLVSGGYGVSGARYMLAAEAKSEPDHEYVMRLRRSYELQQSADVD